MKNVKFLTKFLAPFLFAVIFFSISVVSAGETANPVAVTTHIAPDTFTLGDIATYTITVQHDKDIQPLAPEITPPKGLEFLDKGESPTQELNGQVVHEYWYKFRVDEVGKLTLPSTSVAFNAPDQKGAGESIEGTILAPEATLEVQSLLGIQGGEGIHDIKPLHEISPPWMNYFWVALGVLALLGLFYFIWRKWKSRPVTIAGSPAAPVLTPEQLAYKELEALRVKGLLQIGRTQDHFFELSEIFRRYLENRFQFPAREWTTEEITAHFKHFPGLNEDLKHRARVILNQTDRIKFAKAEHAEGRDEIKTVIGFIREACPPVPQVSKQS
jgi:hypothetical protein